MSEYLTSLVRRALGPELSVRPRLSSVFDPPARAPGWEMSARAPEEESAELEFVEGLTSRRASAALAPDRRSRPAATFDITAADPDGGDQSALVPRRAAARSVTRDAKNAISEDSETHPTSPRENDAQSGAVVLAEQPGPSRKRPSRESPLKTGRNESAALPAPSNDKPKETGLEFRVAAQRTHGAASDKLRPASHTLDARRPFGHDAPTTLVEATAPKVASPGERPEADPGRVGPIEPQLARPRRQRETSPPSEAAEGEGSAIGRPPVLAAKPRPADAKMPTSEAAHAMLATPSRREQEQRDQRVSQASPSTIQVTIGRIEVRATTVAEPRQKSRPSSGATSLVDYLRHRSGRSGS
jgi:hypothetical protein